MRELEGKHIAIVGLGPSSREFLHVCKGLGGRRAYCDEVWGINAIGDVLNCDRIIHMDDVRIQEIRAAERPESNIARMLDWMKTTKTQIISSRCHPDYPAITEYPIEDVLKEFQLDYFNSTAAWAVALAVFGGAEKISLWGIDFTYPDAHDAEKGRGCVEFWLGVAKARGIKVAMPKTTTLMDALYTRQERLYGYDTRTVEIKFDDNGKVNGVALNEIDPATLPSADEIEDRYDHSKHPNELVSGENQ